MALDFLSEDCIYRTLHSTEEFLEKIQREDRRVIIFGAGHQGVVMLRCLKARNLVVSFFCDNNIELHGKKIQGVTCLAPNELVDINNAIILVASTFMEDIMAQLDQLGISDVYCLGEILFNINEEMLLDAIRHKEELLQVFDLLEDIHSKLVYEAAIRQWFDGELAFPKELVSEKQYFDPGVWSLKEDEVYVDCGAYNGDTIRAFIEQTRGGFRKIYGFELDFKNYEALERQIKTLEQSNRITVYNKGVGNETGAIFYQGEQDCARITRDGDECNGVICKLDETIGEATLIKMDVEGFELDALMGAEGIIRKHRPRLAICLYHKLSDYYQTPLYLKRIVPDYQFCIRHYTSVETETVLYAYV